MNKATHEPTAVPGTTILVVVGLVVFGLNFARAIWLDYPYWVDEHYSVTTGTLPYGAFVEALGRETHPPTYQILLRLWMALVGTDHAATRSLSMFFGCATIAVFFFALRGVLNANHLSASLAILISNSLLHYYSQETRSYAFLLFVATLCTVCFVRAKTKVLFPAAILLGFTHFFGAMLSLLYMAWMFLFPTKQALSRRLGLCGSAAIVLYWPVSFVLFGRGGQLVGGSFWIEAGPVDSIQLGLEAAITPYKALTVAAKSLAVPSVLVSLSAAMLGLALGIALLLSYKYRHPDVRQANGLGSFQALAIIHGMLVVAVAVISVHTPLAVARNFICLLPAAALLIGFLFHRYGSPKYKFACIVRPAFVAYVVISLVGSWLHVDKKIEVSRDRQVSSTPFPACGNGTIPLTPMRHSSKLCEPRVPVIAGARTNPTA